MTTENEHVIPESSLQDKALLIVGLLALVSLVYTGMLWADSGKNLKILEEHSSEIAR